jgi:hypothetical protein
VGRGQGDYLSGCLQKNKAYAEVYKVLDHQNAVRVLTARTA